MKKTYNNNNNKRFHLTRKQHNNIFEYTDHCKTEHRYRYYISDEVITVEVYLRYWYVCILGVTVFAGYIGSLITGPNPRPIKQYIDMILHPIKIKTYHNGRGVYNRVVNIIK